MAYGIQMRNADGSLVLNGRQTLPRLVYRVKLPWSFSGLVGVYPDFDEDKGVLSVFPGAFRYTYGASRITRVPESADEWSSADGGAVYAFNSTAFPAVDWNNTTKELNVTAPGGYGGLPSDWWAYFIHYK